MIGYKILPGWVEEALENGTYAGQIGKYKGYMRGYYWFTYGF